ncbi:MAG: CoB--CoM heterodisulfide reductase iron-sulfur subunit A family protein [Methanospirillum sp.]
MPPSIVVVGGGVAGCQAALDLANHGLQVHLVEREPSIGGRMAQLDKTFPTNDCSMCILSPKMVDVARHPLIRVHTLAEVTRLEGERGAFSVTVTHHPRYVDEAVCNGCGDCVAVCPVEVYNRFDAGVGVRKAIYTPHAQAVPNAVAKDPVHCIECGLCYDVCGLDAVRREDSDREETIEAAAVVLATGYDPIDPRCKPQYRYGEEPDVITSLELERMINASGPTGGALRRLSNGETPRSIVFIQCVGSRDVAQGRPWCSAVCCMQAIKNAQLIKEKSPETEVAICYMDVRAHGKGYEEYYERARTLGVRFVRGMPGEVQRSATGPMTIPVEDTFTGEMLRLEPELVVLSIGLQPSAGTAALAKAVGVELEESGFYRSADDVFDAVASGRGGVYFAGAGLGPRDIPDSVAQGGAAAVRACIDALRVE